MSKRIFTTASISVAAAGLFTAIQPSQVTAQQPSELTAMDYIEIQQLVNKLNFALDYCTNGGQDFADLFIEGGRFIIDQGDGMPTVRESRDELIALAWGPDCEARQMPPSSYVLHLAESLVITPTAEGARGLSYAFYPSSKGNYLSDDVAGQLGIYYDDYVKTPDGWRFKLRRHVTNPDADNIGLSD